MSKLADSSFNKANNCLIKQEAQCAIESAKAVLKLNPNYAGAKSLLVEAKALKLVQELAILSADVHQCIYTSKDVTCAEKALYSMQKLARNADETLNAEDELSAFKESLVISSALESAQQCKQENAFDCIIEQSNIVLNLQAEHPDATSLKQQAQQQINQLESKRIAEQKRYDALMANAHDCLELQDFVCAKQSADKALNINSTNEARMLQRSAEMAVVELKRNALEKKRTQERANSMVAQARQCLAKKQYDCAIAKSESALNLVPKYSSALETLKQAAEERQKLKTSFSLQ